MIKHTGKVDCPACKVVEATGEGINDDFARCFEKQVELEEREVEVYEQICVWPHTLMGKGSPKDFEAFMAETFDGTRVKFLEEIVTLPTPGEDGTGGRHDFIFAVHNEDVGKFAVPRLAYGISWWEDMLSNGYAQICPPEILAKYPRRW